MNTIITCLLDQIHSKLSSEASPLTSQHQYLTWPNSYVHYTHSKHLNSIITCLLDKMHSINCRVAYCIPSRLNQKYFASPIHIYSRRLTTWDSNIRWNCLSVWQEKTFSTIVYVAVSRVIFNTLFNTIVSIINFIFKKLKR